MAVAQVRAADVYLQTAGETRSRNNQDVERQAEEQRRQDTTGPAVVADISSEARESAGDEQNLARDRAVEVAEQRQSNRIDAYV